MSPNTYRLPSLMGGLIRTSAALSTLLVWSMSSAAQDEEFRLGDVVQWASEGKYEEAKESLDQAIEQSPDRAELYYWRGRVAFCLAQIDQSVADFDRYVELEPDLERRQWERGISLYYAKEFERGAKQFELYQTYHDNDVENSTWRFMCVARSSGIEAARENMLPIRNDRRVPMMEIFAMFRGELTPDQVMRAANVEGASEAVTNRQKFYAHLYIGLYQEALGNDEKAIEHLKLAQSLKIDHYMWNVADVHVRLAEDRRD